MALHGVIRGRTIELEHAPPLPDGTAVEVNPLSHPDNPFWRRLGDDADLLTEIAQGILTARECTSWWLINWQGAN